jgi:hypothetical protein
MVSHDPRHLAKIQQLDKQQLEQSLPDIFDDGDSRNVLTIARRHYIKMCAALAEQYSQPETLTLVAFHGAIDFLTERNTSRSPQKD